MASFYQVGKFVGDDIFNAMKRFFGKFKVEYDAFALGIATAP